MAHYRHLHHHARYWSAAAAHRFLQPQGGSVPVDSSTVFLVPGPQTHVYLYAYEVWFPPQYTLNMAAYSDDRLQMIDENLVIDAPTFPRTIHDQQQMIDGHSIMDLNLLPSHNTQHLSGPNRNRGGPLLSEEAISKHMKTRAPTRQDTAEMCTVCQDDLHEEGRNDELIATLDCGHGYHSNCIKTWLRQKNVCPLCNAIAITPQDII